MKNALMTFCIDNRYKLDILTYVLAGEAFAVIKNFAFQIYEF